MRLCVTKKALELPVFVFLFSFPSVILDGLKKLILYFACISALGAGDQLRTNKHDMSCALEPCPLEKNVNGGFKGELAQSCFSTTTNIISPLSMGTKLGRIVTCHEEFPPIKSHISTTAMLIATKFGWMMTCLESLLPTISYYRLISVLAKSCDILQPLYLHYHSAYGQQTWQDDDIP